ncbi:MAG: peptidoglycan-binding protein, partial [Bradyrhizobium sp.]|nr:peptidoglycan-binding protein [Bradyrhizobium sp.]
MRSLSTATWMSATLLLAGSPALAQMTQPPSVGTKPKAVATVPISPAGQAPADTANAMTQADRLALQSDLAWIGQYNGAITGDVSTRMVNAVKDYQKLKGGQPTGVLNPQERAVLADTARRKQESVGWKLITDPVSGARLGIPAKLVPQQVSDANGSKWSSPDGSVQVQLSRRKEANPTMAALADREKNDPPGRTVDYTVVKPDFFVLSGLQGQKKFYIR